MEIVIDKELLGEYFCSISPKKKEEKSQRLSLAIENEKNKIKVSSKYLEILESYFESISNTQIDFFQQFISELSDDNRLITFESKIESQDEELLIEEIFSHDFNDFTFILTKSPLNNNEKPYHSVYDSVIKPNKDWFILSLSTCNVVHIDYSDFSHQADIDLIFKLCGKLPNKEKSIHIIDSHFTLNETTLLKHLRGNGFKVKCYTSSFNKTKDEKEIRRQRIKMFFGKKASVKFSNNKSFIHERKILISSLLVDSTHDFSEITINNSNWSVYLIICNDKKDTTLEKLEKYN